MNPVIAWSPSLQPNELWIKNKVVKNWIQVCKYKSEFYDFLTCGQLITELSYQDQEDFVHESILWSVILNALA
jgi:hypothetical protein